MNALMAGTVECLNCGERREARRHDDARCIHLDDCCARCGYVGWAATADVTEATRRILRDRPLPRRRLLVAA